MDATHVQQEPRDLTLGNEFLDLTPPLQDHGLLEQRRIQEGNDVDAVLFDAIQFRHDSPPLPEDKTSVNPLILSVSNYRQSSIGREGRRVTIIAPLGSYAPV